MSERERLSVDKMEKLRDLADSALQEALSCGLDRDMMFRFGHAAALMARSGQAASGSSQGARSDDQNGFGVGQPEAPTAAPPRWKRVPVRPTAEMLESFGGSQDAEVWAAMLAASPAAPLEAGEPVAPLDFSADAVRKTFEASFLDYFGRQPEGAVFDELGGFWLARTEDGRYEIARVDDAWTGWLAAARYYAHIETLWRAAKLGHEQMYELAVSRAQEIERLSAHPPARSGAGSEEGGQG